MTQIRGITIIVLLLPLFPLLLFAENLDSLSYYEKIQQLQLDASATKEYASAIETAEVLASEGMFEEAVDILDKLVFATENSTTQEQVTTNNTTVKREPITEVETHARYTRIVDVNEKELTSVQKDSVSLSNRYLLGTGIKQTWFLDRLGIEKVKASLFFTNVTVAPALQIIGAYFDSLFIIDNRFTLEKRTGKFYSVTEVGDTSGSGNNTVVNVSSSQEYEWVNFKKDSSDLVANMFVGEFSNRSRASRLLFSIPLKWTYMFFRKNRPLFGSRSIYSTNPYLEYRLSRLDMILSANWFFEKSNYFHSGVALSGFPDSVYATDVLDKVYNSPQINLSGYLNKLYIEVSQMLIWEYFPERKGILENINQRVNDDNLDSINYELIENSRWWQTNARLSYRLLPWLTAKFRCSYLYVNDEVTLNKYYTLLNSIINGKLSELEQVTLTGSDLVIIPELEFRLPRSFIIGCEYLWEKRDAPIKGPYNVAVIGGSKRVSQKKYLWEKYTAHAPAISLAYNPNAKINMKVSQTLRYEDVVSDSSYTICNSIAPKTRWDMLVQLTKKFSISCNGDIEVVNYLSDQTLSGGLVDRKKTNISLSMDMNYKF